MNFTPEQRAIIAGAKKHTLNFINKCLEILEGGRDLAPSERYTLYQVYKVEATPPANEARVYFGKLIEFTDAGYETSIASFFAKTDSESFKMNFFCYILIGISGGAAGTFLYCYR